MRGTASPFVELVPGCTNITRRLAVGVKLGHPVTLIYLKVRAIATDYAYSDANSH